MINYLKMKTLFFVFLSMSVLSCVQKEDVTVVLKNHASFARMDEAVTISREEIQAFLTPVVAGKLPVLVSETGDTIAVQHDDLTADGIWDEVFFLISLEAGEEKRLRLVFTDPDKLPKVTRRSNVRFAMIQDEHEYIPLIRAERLGMEEGLAGGVYQMEGPAWENDQVGFRNYFDVRNGMDIFGKTTTGMVLDRVGINEDYHVMQAWGMDILRVGASLGSGSLALEKDGKLFRVAPGAAGSYELITDGPLRSALRLRFDNWDVAGQTYQLVHDISIWGGAWFYESRVYLEGQQGEGTIVSGITSIDLENKESVIEYKEGDVAFVATHGAQAYDGENLGMAIMLPEKLYDGFEHIGGGDDIVNTFIVRMPVKDDQPAVFRFYACWEVSDHRFSDGASFVTFMKQEANSMSQPIEVRIR